MARLPRPGALDIGVAGASDSEDDADEGSHFGVRELIMGGSTNGYAGADGDDDSYDDDDDDDDDDSYDDDDDSTVAPADEWADDDSYYTEEEEYGTWLDWAKYYASIALDSWLVTAIMLLALFVALYSSDIRLAVFSKEADFAFDAMGLCAFALFMAELGMTSWLNAGYMFSFYWWLDLFATVSLLLDIQLIMEPLRTRLASTNASELYNEESITGSITRAIRAARVGTHAGRVVRSIRVLRLFQLSRARKVAEYYARLYAHARRPVGERAEAAAPVWPAAAADKPAQVSLTGQILSDKIIMASNAGVLLFAVVFPFLRVLHQVHPRAHYEARAVEGAIELARGGVDAQTLALVRAQLVGFWRVLSLALPALRIDEAARRAQLRPHLELATFIVRGAGGGGGAAGYAVVVDVSADSRAAAFFAMGLTTFLLLLLACLVVLFNHVSTVYCIAPMEAVMRMMRDFSDNPLDKMKVLNVRAGGLSETSQLLEAIAKITSLLQIGFGEAGATIIGSNLANRGEINPMTPGRKMVGLFGFVVIFDFGEATEALREAVMLYVNRIAAIVHGCVHGFAGSINKNIGEAFLTVWPLEHRAEKRERLLQRASTASTILKPGAGAKRPPISPTKPSPTGRAAAGARWQSQSSLQRALGLSGSGSTESLAAARQYASEATSRLGYSQAQRRTAQQGASGSSVAESARPPSPSRRTRKLSAEGSRVTGDARPPRSDTRGSCGSADARRPRSDARGSDGSAGEPRARSGTFDKRASDSESGALPIERRGSSSTVASVATRSLERERSREAMRASLSAALRAHEAGTLAQAAAREGEGEATVASRPRYGVYVRPSMSVPGGQVGLAAAAAASAAAAALGRAAQPADAPGGGGGGGGGKESRTRGRRPSLRIADAADPSAAGPAERRRKANSLEHTDSSVCLRARSGAFDKRASDSESGALPIERRGSGSTGASLATRSPERERSREAAGAGTLGPGADAAGRPAVGTAREGEGEASVASRPRYGRFAPRSQSVADSQISLAAAASAAAAALEQADAAGGGGGGGGKGSRARGRRPSLRVADAANPSAAGSAERRRKANSPERADSSFYRAISDSVRAGSATASGSFGGCAADAPPACARTLDDKAIEHKVVDRRGSVPTSEDQLAVLAQLQSKMSSMGNKALQLRLSNQPSTSAQAAQQGALKPPTKGGAGSDASSATNSPTTSPRASSVSRTAWLAMPAATPAALPAAAAGASGGLSERLSAAPSVGEESFTTADCAVAGFALCTLLVRGNSELRQLCSNALLQRMHPGFEVNTGYGLHTGWAIEGAIGSNLKIDASYLSSNVNLASRIEAATKQYRVRILLSEHVASIMSLRCRSMLRKVDRVTVKGSEQPISLFTLDIAEDEANVRAALELDPTAVLSDEARAARRALLQQRIADAHADGDASEAQQQDPSLMQVELDAFEELEAEERMFARTAAVYWLRLATTPEFLDSWQLAQRSYVAGDWGRAKPHFERCRELLPTDGPTATLMAYLERRDWTSPADWTGVRELTSK